MPTLHHFRLCPHSRAVRFALGELGAEVVLADEQPWLWRPELATLNPAGELPVLVLDSGPVLCGLYAIAEYAAEASALLADGKRAPPLFPGSAVERAETRRLVDWFQFKLDREVTTHLLEEKVYGRLRAGETSSPDVEALGAARSNLKYHLAYAAHLLERRSWLAGEEMSFADLAAAAHFSVADYLGEIDWPAGQPLRGWYAKLKSRPAFRAILAERVPGAPTPPSYYADPDF